MDVEYKYALLRHRPSLYLNETENIAVLVEGPVGERQVIFLVGCTPHPSVSVSEISESIGRSMPEILESLIRDAIRSKKPQDDVLTSLAQSMSWNYSVSEPASVRDSGPISAVAFKLFSQYVAGADQLVENYEEATRRQVRPAETKIRMGDTFLTLLPVPGPELTVRSAGRAAGASD